MQLRRLAAISSRIKPHNEKVYYIIDGVQNAILENRQIQFQYYEYTQQKERVLKHNGYFYKLDPYALEWKNDHYYLIGYSHKHHGMAHFRVDRLAGIEVLESTYVPQPDFDVADYTNKMIDMFAAGHTVLVELLCENRFMKTIVDDYGEAVPTHPYDSEHFAAQIECEPQRDLLWMGIQVHGRSQNYCSPEVRGGNGADRPHIPVTAGRGVTII